ncbi:6-bladed beta-propeller [Seonamhaeicola sediminis]|uniref:6-bladed beta-propeller n=1 Tax=Seonamhaeicola sediminis TaxID=2528206 RepID=A0A562YAM9_9FLAO|nr:6-bladed beta-propeller [Seonamhaeicola sediminis]TWO31560.1 6-bladed beta-propeller [Seonamhaeicola sediminis]
MNNKKNLIKLSFFAFTLLFFNCANESKNNISLKSIDSSGKNEKIETKNEDVKLLNVNNVDATKVIIPSDIFNSSMDLNDIIYDIELTPLETTSESLIGRIHNILYDSNFYFIHDKRNNKLLRFNENGKFLNSIGAIGKGPQELLSIRDVAINAEKKFISILDSKSRKVSRYRYSGEFIDSKPFYYMVSEHEYGNNFLVFGASIVQKNENIPLVESYRLIVADTNYVPLGLAFKTPENSFVYATTRPLRKFNNSIYYHQPFSNGIWKAEYSNLIPLIKFEFEKNGFPNEVWKQQISTKELRSLKDKHVHFSGDFLISDNFGFFKFYSSGKVSSIILNLESQNLMYGRGLKYTNDNPSMMLYREPIGAGENNSFVAKIDAIELFHYRQAVEDGTFKNGLKSEYWEIIKNIKETDNPLIVTYKLKDF